MKNLDLNAYGVVAMPKQEMQKTDGGNPWLLLLAANVIGGLLYEIGANPVHSSKKIAEGAAAAPTFDFVK